jgi:acyl dehydratase
MTIYLEEPADLLDLVGSPLGTTKWIHTDPQRAARGPFKGTVAHSFLTLSLTPMFTSEVLQIRELTMAFTYGLGKVNFCAAVPVGSLVRATVSVISARQKTSGVESVFGLSYDIDGIDRPACTAEVSVLYA